MKTRLSILTLVAATATTVFGQQNGTLPAEVQPANAKAAAPVPGLEQPAATAPATTTQAPAATTAPAAMSPQAAPAPVAPVMRQDETGLWVNMELNDLIAVLAKRGHLQYFSNPSLDGKIVKGHINNDGDPVEQMRALCFQYGATLFEKSGTVYALDSKQVLAMPRREWVYTVKYLRGRLASDQKAILDLINPAMSEKGQARYEDKTGTLVVIDNEASVASVKNILERVDVPKKQVVVEVRILRLQNQRAHRQGVDWSQTLGKGGLQVSATALGKIGELFDKGATFGAATKSGTDAATTAVGAAADGATGGGVILSPVTVTAVLRALNEGNLATQENAPTLITEDNEQANIRITDRIPIIEQTATQSSGVAQITTDVRYRIDKSDSLEPEKSREVGVTVSVTPSILPDGTIRMKMYPRVANVTEYVDVQTGVDGIVNKVPRVGEAGVESIARIPNGYTLFLGGYYQTEERSVDSKVPLLGDIPGLSFVFRSKQREKNKANVVFMLTPTTYDPASAFQTVGHTERLRQHSVAPAHFDYPDDENPGENEIPRPIVRARNLVPFGKPEREADPFSAQAVSTERRVETPQDQRQEQIKRSYRGH